MAKVDERVSISIQDIIHAPNGHDGFMEILCDESGLKVEDWDILDVRLKGTFTHIIFVVYGEEED